MANKEYIKGVKYKANDSCGIRHITRGDIITVDPLKGSIETVNGKPCPSNIGYCFPSLSCKLWIPINSNKSNKMATKKKTTGIALKDGQYYTAVVNRKKIRGKVYEDGDGNFHLLNNQGCGDEACDFNEDSDFSYGIFIELIDAYGNDVSTVEESFKSQHVTQFTVATDKRIKAVIDRDILPETAGFRVRKNADGKYSFGCGAVELTAAQIKNFLTHEKKRQELLDALSNLDNEKTFDDWDYIGGKYTSETASDLEDLDLNEVEELLKY